MGIRISAFLLCLFSCAYASSQEVLPELAATFVEVKTGGYWESDSARGSYRAIIENRGIEHVSSQLWIEWVADPTPTTPAQIVASVLVEEVSGGFWSLSIESLGHSSSGGRLTISGTNVHTLETARYELILSEPSEYRFFEILEVN